MLPDATNASNNFWQDLFNKRVQIAMSFGNNQRRSLYGTNFYKEKCRPILIKNKLTVQYLKISTHTLNYHKLYIAIYKKLREQRLITEKCIATYTNYFLN